MTETKHSPTPLPFRGHFSEHCPYLILGEGGMPILEIKGAWTEEEYIAIRRFIVLAVNHFEEMRGLIDIVASCVGWEPGMEPGNVCPACQEDARKFLAKLKEAEDE